MKKLKFFYYIIAISLLAGCGSDDAEMSSGDGGITVDFTFTSDGNLFTFTNLSQGATSYKWDFGDLSFYCDKENPSYRYTRAGGDLNVTLTAMNDSGESYATKTISAPEVKNISIEIDGSIDDWNDVDVLVDDTALGNNTQILKLWADGENLYFYIEGNTSMLLELLSIFINTDGNSNTGFEAWQWGGESGADFLFQGPIGPLWWGDTYTSPFTTELGGWAWNWTGGVDGFVSSNLINVDADTNAMEFSIPRSRIAATGDTISLALSELNGGWVDVSQIPNSGDDSKFVIYEFPVESSGLCE